MKIKKQLAVTAMVVVFMVSTLFAGQVFNSKTDNLLANFIAKVSEVKSMAITTLLQLDITKEQKEGIKEIIVTTLKDNKQLLLNAGNARKEMADAVHSETFNEQAVRNAFQKMVPYGEEVAVVRAKAVSKIKALLTTAQKEKLKQLC